MVTFAFHCNIACQFCMVEDALNVLPGTSLETFREAARDPERLRGLSRIIFTGGEVTLSKELPAYAEFARSLPGIRHVRVQTNATRLADRATLRTLIDAGVDEYFVSLHAPDAALCDAITQRPGTFELIMAGMQNIVAAGATLVTNTAIVQSNYGRLSEIVERVAPLRPKSMEFWNYWPRGDDDARRGYSARITDVRPHLVEALGGALRHGIPPVVKWFPRCLLGPYVRYHDNGQPRALIDEAYWTEEPAYACIYEGICEAAGETCSGLSHSYVRQHGWEEDVLQPGAATDLRQATNAERVETRSLVKGLSEKQPFAPAVVQWLGTYGLKPGMEAAGFHLRGAVPGRGTARLTLQFERAGKKAEVWIQPTNPGKAALSRTPSFDLLYSRVEPDLERSAHALAMAIADAVRSHDAGGGSLPG
jgi:cyclic pyranopterin phosphate synthase